MSTNLKPKKYEIDPKMAKLIRTKPGLTRKGKPFDHVVTARMAKGE